MRLPSQWKKKVLPHALFSKGVTESNFSTWLLEILKSIYGQVDASKLWKETLTRVLERIGFKESPYEEGLYFRIRNEVLTIVSTYVDDVWCFSLSDEEVIEVLAAVAEELACTPAQMLCGAPRWFWLPSVVASW